MVHPRCPNCKKVYRFFPSDDDSYNFMLKHDSPTCPYKFVSYQDLEERCIEDIREAFKQEFPYLYKDARKALS